MKQENKKGAVYNVYAGADIVAADGSTVYKKGDLVKRRSDHRGKMEVQPWIT